MADSQDQSSNVVEASSSSSAQPSTSTSNVCANCNKPESEKPLTPCIACKSVSYCSRDCKKAHFKKHKTVCATAAQEYAKTADFKPASRTLPKKDAVRGGLQKWQFDT